MKCLCLLGLAASKSKAVFKVIYGTLDCCADFVCGIPFYSTTKCTRISAKIFFGINVYHTPAFGIRAGIITSTCTMGTFRFRIIVPKHFGTDELISGNTTAEFGDTFVFHWECFVVWTTWDAIVNDFVINIFKMGS